MGGGGGVAAHQPHSQSTEMTHFKFNLTTNLPHDFQKQESMRQDDPVIIKRYN